MLVGIDVSVALAPALSGVGFHIIRLVEQLDRVAPTDWSFKLFYPVRRDSTQEEEARSRFSEFSARTQFVGVPFLVPRLALANELYSRGTLPWAIRRAGCDVFHGPAHSIPRVKGTPTVVTIHDLAFFEIDIYDAAFSRVLRDLVSWSIRHATRVIAVSEHTRRHITHRIGRDAGVEVIYGAGNYALPADVGSKPGDTGILAGIGVDRPYVLYVGDFNPRKNLPYLITSFARLKHLKSFEDVQLVLVGNSSKAAESIDQQRQTLGLSPRDVILSGKVSDELLKVIYRNASTFALCSVMEGFTLVTLEAMSYGIPVVATNTSSIAEGTGDAAELVPLDSPDDVARALATALTPSRRRDEMRRLGLERIRNFSWEGAARRTLRIYSEAASSRIR